MKIQEGYNTKVSQANKLDSQVDNVAKGMEKIFVKYMLDELRKSGKQESLFSKKNKNDFFESELYDEYARLIVERGDFGLAEMIKTQINKTISGGRK